MRLNSDSKIVIWLVCCALLAAFLQTFADRYDFARLRNSPRKTVVRPRQVRARRKLNTYALAS